MLSDHHEPSPESSVADDDHQDELSSIGHSSLLAPPMSHRQLHPYTNPQPDRQRLHSPPVESQVAPLDPSSLTFVTTGIHRPLAASSGPLRTITHSDHPHDISLPNPNPLSPHPSWFHRPQTPPPQGPVLFSDGYAPAESLPPQHYIPPARTVPPPPPPPPPIINATPIYPPLSHGTSFLSLTLGGAAPPVAGIPSPSAIVPPNSELARPPRFTFAPPGAIVPADTVVSATPTPSGSATPTCSRKRDKAKGKLLLDRDRASQPTQEGSSGRRARSNSWSVVSSVFRRRSGRNSGPVVPLPALTPATDVPPSVLIGPPQPTASDWRDLAQWAHRTTDNRWGEVFDDYRDVRPSIPSAAVMGETMSLLPIELEASSGSYEHSLPPLPPHLSHLPVPSPPLMRTDARTSALNPFLVHRPVGIPPLSWDLRTSARSIFFPSSSSSSSSSGPTSEARPAGTPTPTPAPGFGFVSLPLPPAAAVPMAPSDYAQPATWPPCGALRIGAIGGHTRWLWPVEVRNSAGVRCGDVFRALVANLGEFVRSEELGDMPAERVAVIVAACTARVAAAAAAPGVGAGAGAGAGGLSVVGSGTTTRRPLDGIRRVDCLLGYTQFHGLEPGPSAGEWTMFVGAP